MPNLHLPYTFVASKAGGLQETLWEAIEKDYGGGSRVRVGGEADYRLLS